MVFGNVYVFNLYADNMSALNLNGMGSAGSVGAPTRSSDPPYAPAQLIVPRTNLNQQQIDYPLFVNGSNDLSFNFGGESWRGEISIPSPPQIPIQADLWLYICYRKAFLFDTTGNLLQSISMD